MKYFQTFETFISNTTVGNGIEISYQTGPSQRMQMGVSSRKSKIAIYFDRGVKPGTISVWNSLTSKYFNIFTDSLDLGELTLDKLKDYDLLIMPGGESATIEHDLEPEHRDAIKEYAKQGGKILGVCAGAYVISSGDNALDMLPVDFVAIDEISEDVLFLDFEITNKGHEVFNTELDSIKLDYHQGPIFHLTEQRDGLEILLKFDSDVEHIIKDEKPIQSIGKIAALMCDYGKGRVMAISPHLEKSNPPAIELIANAISYLIEKRRFEIF